MSQFKTLRWLVEVYVWIWAEGFCTVIKDNFLPSGFFVASY